MSEKHDQKPTKFFIIDITHECNRVFGGERVKRIKQPLGAIELINEVIVHDIECYDTVSCYTSTAHEDDFFCSSHMPNWSLNNSTKDV